MTTAQPNTDDGDGIEFEFAVGDTLVEQDMYNVHVDGVGAVTGATEYTVTRRLVDADEGEGFYFVEYEDGQKTRTSLKSATMVHGLYTTTDTEASD